MDRSLVHNPILVKLALMVDHLAVDAVALDACASALRRTALDAAAAQLSAVAAQAAEVLPACRSAPALARVAVAWQQVLQRLGDRSAALGDALVAAGRYYDAVDGAVACAARVSVHGSESITPPTPP